MSPRLHSRLRFAPAAVEVERRSDGSMILRSPQALGEYERCAGEWLETWAGRFPERLFLAERAGEGWREVSYAQALDAVRRIGQGLLERGLGPDEPLAILSENGVDHALLALGAMHAGVPVAPISPAYSLISKDHARLRAVFGVLEPGLVWVDDPSRYAGALAAVGAEPVPLQALLERPPGARIDEAFAGVGPETVAKILFTSGSTGVPRGVINTQRMLVSNQQMVAQVWPFLEERTPRLVDWLPWNHTFGGNFCFNLVLRNGGSFYVDAGRPAPGLVETTTRNLRDVSPNLYFNVPRGFDLLLPHLEQEADLRRRFFRELELLFYAGAALPQNLWERLERLAVEERGGELAMVSAWGSTETAPSATNVHYPIDRAGVIGLPNPGCELKLVPAAGRLEVRVRGPHVTPGYFRRGDLTRASFDEEGFYCTGDAMRFADPATPERGLVFDGRVAEDFKLSSGTWVRVGAVRIAFVAACDPLVQDAVITGHDRDEVGALAFPSAAARELPREVLRSRLAEAVTRLAAAGGSSTHPARVLVLDEPPSIDAGEITDKGYINQRAVLARRSDSVEQLHAPVPPPDVITPSD